METYIYTTGGSAVMGFQTLRSDVAIKKDFRNLPAGLFKVLHFATNEGYFPNIHGGPCLIEADGIAGKPVTKSLVGGTNIIIAIFASRRQSEADFHAVIHIGRAAEAESITPAIIGAVPSRVAILGMVIAQAQIPFERQAINPAGHAIVEFGVGFLGEHIGLGLSNHTFLNELF